MAEEVIQPVTEEQEGTPAVETEQTAEQSPDTAQPTSETSDTVSLESGEQNDSVAEESVPEECKTETQEPSEPSEVSSEEPLENGPDYEKLLKEANENIAYLAKVVYAVFTKVDEKMISKEVMAGFDRTIREQMGEIKLSATKTLLTQIADLRERTIILSDKMKASKESMSVDQAIDNIDIFESMLEELLVVNGLTPFRDEIGEPYVYPKHNKGKLIDTDDITKNKTIAKVVRNGYLYGETVILPENVDVYRYVEKKE